MPVTDDHPTPSPPTPEVLTSESSLPVDSEDSVPDVPEVEPEAAVADADPEPTAAEPEAVDTEREPEAVAEEPVAESVADAEPGSTVSSKPTIPGNAVVPDRSRSSRLVRSSSLVPRG